MSFEKDSTFARVIEDHLELKRKNTDLEREMPISGYHVDDPFQNHPLFKTEEQARIEDTLSGVEPALVSFDQRFTPGSEVVTGTAVPNPGFGSPGADTHDLALIVLDTPVTNRGYAQLPTPGRLASADKKNPLTIVGYGANGFVKGGGKPAPDFRLVRSFGDSRISKVEKTGFNLRMQAGICFGDSGGPVILGDSNLVVGVASFVNNGRCAGNAFAYRLDTAASLDFLAPYL